MWFYANYIQNIRNQLEEVRIKLEENPNDDLLFLEQKLQDTIGTKLAAEAWYWKINLD